MWFSHNDNTCHIDKYNYNLHIHTNAYTCIIDVTFEAYNTDTNDDKIIDNEIRKCLGNDHSEIDSEHSAHQDSTGKNLPLNVHIIYVQTIMIIQCIGI